MSTTTQTLREPKAQRLRNNPIPQNIVEAEKLEMSLEPHAPLDRDEQDILEGQTGYPPLTMKEIVAICKEARAERYAEEQKQKNAAHC